MKFGRQGGAKRNGSRGAGRPKGRKAPLAAHGVFAPMLGVWGALLGGLTTLAVGPAVFERAVRGTLFATLGVPSQPALAIFMAAVLGSALFGLATVLHRRTLKHKKGITLAERAARRVRPIDPLRDLGSKSLDDPLEAMPFATPAWRDADLDADAAPSASETASEAAESRQAAPSSTPRALDLAEFGQMPGRNGVWVEETAAPAPAPEAAPAPAPAAPARKAARPRSRDASGAALVSALRAARPQAPRPAPGTAALARLRAVPPSELSLLEMVERFAGALHEHRTAFPASALSASELAARETALAEALKALAALSADTAARGLATPGEVPPQARPAGLQAQRRMERGAA